MTRIQNRSGRTLGGLIALFCAFALPIYAQTDPVTTGTTAPADASTTNNATPYYAPAPGVPRPPLNALPPSAASQATPQDDIYDIRPPYFYLHPWLWVWLAVAISALIAIALLAWLLLRPHRQLSAKSAYELALEKLEKARGLLRENEPMPYAVMVSETIRSYLSQRFQTPSTRRTTEEFLRQMERDPTSHLAEHRDVLRGFLQSCDLVKFARYQPTLVELEQVQQNAHRFVTATKPIAESSAQNGAGP